MSKSKFLCGIVGHPLKVPRSIIIWKRYFNKNKISSSMEGFDLKPQHFSKFVEFIKKEKKFLAMAVTMPYKKKILKYLDKLDAYAFKTQSVNLVVKKSKLLLGYNTDVFGAIESIKKEIKLYDNILIIGLGGTGQAIYNFLSKTFKSKSFILISSKSKKLFKRKNLILIKKLNTKIIGKSSLIINCTPLGSSLKKNLIKKTPIKESQFRHINRTSFIFDVVYSPKKTKLSKLCKKYKIRYINGILMNTVQAQRALQIVFGR